MVKINMTLVSKRILKNRRLNTLRICNNRCVCCEKLVKSLVYKEIERLRIVLCRSCNRLFIDKDYNKLLLRIDRNKVKLNKQIIFLRLIKDKVKSSN